MTKRHWSRFALMALLALLISPSIVEVHAGTPTWGDLAWSPDGKFLVAVGFDVALYTDEFELIEQVEHYVLTKGFYAESVAWNPQGTHFATFDFGRSFDNVGFCALRIWQAHPLKLLHSEISCGTGGVVIRGIVYWNSKPIWNPAGDAVLFIGGTGSDQVTYDLFSLNIETFTISEIDPPVRIESRGQTIITAFDELLLTASSTDLWRYETLESTISLISPATGSITTLIELPDRVSSLSAYMNIIALNVSDQVYLYDLHTGNLLRNLEIVVFEATPPTNDFAVREFSWSPDGRYLALDTATGAGIWEVRTGKFIQSLWENMDIYGVAWHPSGDKLVLATGYWFDDVDFKIFDVSGLMHTN